MSIIKYIIGGLLCAMILPVFGLFALVLWLFYEVLVPLKDFCVDFVRSLADESYVPPIGYSGTMRRDYEHAQGEQAARRGDWKEAMAHWQEAARLYDADAMFKLGECFENGTGTDICLDKACEYYHRAARQRHAAAIEACKRLG
jgi:hypothetical protein